MTRGIRKKVGEGGAKEKGSDLDRTSDPALRKENRQAVKNQSEVSPEDYPDRSQTPV